MEHKNLEVWKTSMSLVTEIYKITRDFPKEEMYGITSQIRRTAISIPSNIAEGAARNSDKELIQFLYIALGSSAELETQIIIAENLNYINQNYINSINNNLLQVKKMLIGMIKYLKNKKKK